MQARGAPDRSCIEHYKNTPLLQRIYALLEVEISVAKAYTNA